MAILIVLSESLALGVIEYKVLINRHRPELFLKIKFPLSLAYNVCSEEVNFLKNGYVLLIVAINFNETVVSIDSYPSGG